MKRKFRTSHLVIEPSRYGGWVISWFFKYPGPTQASDVPSMITIHSQFLWWGLIRAKRIAKFHSKVLTENAKETREAKGWN